MIPDVDGGRVEEEEEEGGMGLGQVRKPNFGLRIYYLMISLTHSHSTGQY